MKELVTCLLIVSIYLRYGFKHLHSIWLLLYNVYIYIYIYRCDSLLQSSYLCFVRKMASILRSEYPSRFCQNKIICLFFYILAKEIDRYTKVKSLEKRNRNRLMLVLKGEISRRKILIKLPDVHVENANHDNSVILQTGSQKLVRTKNYFPYWIVENFTLLLLNFESWYKFYSPSINRVIPPPSFPRPQTRAKKKKKKAFQEGGLSSFIQRGRPIFIKEGK